VWEWFVRNRTRNVPISGKSVAQLGFSGLYEKRTDGPCTSAAYGLFLYNFNNKKENLGFPVKYIDIVFITNR
jgi:hypothetical protein